MRHNKRGFTPLEKAADFSRRLLPHKADCGSKPLSAQTDRECNSLTGFTLSELILASAITALALAGLIIFFVQCFLISAEARSSTIAVSHAQYIMEDIKNTPFGAIAANISAGQWNWNSSGISSAGLAALNGENTIVGCSGADPLHITVTVNWQNPRGVNKSAAIETLITS